jgi:uncharacterized membrane protein
LAGLTVVSVGLYLAGALANRNLQFDYLLWNLFLAWLPLLLTAALLRDLRRRPWTSWRPFALTLLWLVLLPNTFYMISDFVHIQDVMRHNLLYDVVMFTAFIFTAVLLGFASLSMVHAGLRRRLTKRGADSLVGVILFLCSFAIYLGRDLRWNSWDVLVNPAGILFDVSDHIIHPLQGGALLSITFSFFVLLSSLYVVGWQLADALRHAR